MIYCHSPSDVPQSEHWVIVEFVAITIPGDERSRTNPGHGYPEHSESVCKYIAFTDRGLWEKEIMRRHQLAYQTKFVAFRVPGLARIESIATLIVEELTHRSRPHDQ